MADHEQDWQPYPVDPYSCYGTCDNNIYIDTYIYIYIHKIVDMIRHLAV